MANKIRTDFNTYIPICYEEKENAFQSINYSSSINRVPKLNISSRNRSSSRFSTSSSSENDFNIPSIQTDSITRNIQTKLAPPLPKPQGFSGCLEKAQKSNELYNNYAPAQGRTKRSLSGFSYSTPLTEIYPSYSSQGQAGNISLDYSQFSSLASNNFTQKRQNLIPPSYSNEQKLSKQTLDEISRFKLVKQDLKRKLDLNDFFENSVATSLKDLQYLGTRKQEIMKDTIQELDNLYKKYEQNNIFPNGDTTTFTYKSDLDTSQQQIPFGFSTKENDKKFEFEDFCGSVSIKNAGEEEQPCQDFSMSNYRTPEVSLVSRGINQNQYY